MFGGSSLSSDYSDDLFVVDLKRHSVVSVCMQCKSQQLLTIKC